MNIKAHCTGMYSTDINTVLQCQDQRWTNQPAAAFTDFTGFRRPVVGHFGWFLLFLGGRHLVW